MIRQLVSSDCFTAHISSKLLVTELSEHLSYLISIDVPQYVYVLTKELC